MSSCMNTGEKKTNCLLISDSSRRIKKAIVLKWLFSRNELILGRAWVNSCINTVAEKTNTSHVKRLEHDQENSEVTPDSSSSEIRAVVIVLVKRTNSGKTVDELMNEYEGREYELVTHLRRFKLYQGCMRPEVESLVEKTNPGKSVDELMYQYRAEKMNSFLIWRGFTKIRLNRP